MKAIVLAAAIASAEMQDAPLRQSQTRDKERRGRPERNRFTEADLEELLGAMEPTPDEPPSPVVIPEFDFIGWDPASHREPPSADGEPLAA